jgi:SpoVK/Ycf46/Vps4 family AAA+-type ATPase
MTLSDDVNLEEFVMAKDELSGADIKAVCTEAGLLALRERRMRVTQVSARTVLCNGPLISSILDVCTLHLGHVARQGLQLFFLSACDARERKLAGTVSMYCHCDEHDAGYIPDPSRHPFQELQRGTYRIKLQRGTIESLLVLWLMRIALTLSLLQYI